MIRKAVGAIILDERNRYLLVHKTKVKGKAETIRMDSWDFVKGGIEEGESPIQALFRELLEETGYTNYKMEKEFSDKICFDFSSDFTQMSGYTSQETTMFLVRCLGGVEKLVPRDDEIDKVEFYSREKILEMLGTSETIEYWNQYLQGALQ